MAKHADVLIVGGGVIGLTAAYFLARAGLTVEVLERGELGQESSWAGAGILPPASAAHARHPYDLLRALSADMFPALSQELRERTGIDNGFLACGGLEFLPAGVHDFEDEWCPAGVECQKLDEANARQLEPALAEGLGAALHLPTLSQLRNPRHLKALAAGCQALGVRLRTGCPVHAFRKERDKIEAVQSALGDVSAARFIIASGAWTDGLLASVGVHVPIKPVRGQIALLNTGVPLFGRVLMIGARYLVPRPEGRVLIGSTEDDVGFDKRTTAQAVHDLIELGIGLVPALADAALERAWAGLRPGSGDGLPFLGLAPGFDNLLIAAGHFRAGITLSPATARLLTELITGKPPSIPLETFAPGRSL